MREKLGFKTWTTGQKRGQERGPKSEVWKRARKILGEKKREKPNREGEKEMRKREMREKARERNEGKFEGWFFVV